jgi:hypothetical protein
MTHGTYAEAKARVERIDAMMDERYRATVKAAGLDPSCGAIHTNNAMCDYSYGRPWAGVNYSLVRKARRIERQRGDAYRILDAYYSRICRENPYPQYMHILFPGQCRVA